ncbi:BlaI/MecI/CopY family transcriptional regulator [Actinacidiphila acididurans]|uniref:BlaI/MecI/CopY family transcriptional regulator n=1 Tax=Actinacidiphila acididurans TaxID=2784346 RepID=A0ABS2TLW2_9ACTN|nr:BlaI/MecI/CopY family transcriptional regulator [Actinacidiphila acididurans]MBM9504333.1 BlaI/MecI/CopY family transcriptional regulator [Actinacidiphila acididurans]
MTPKDGRQEARRRGRGEPEGDVLAALRAAGGPVTAAVVQQSVTGAAYTTVLTILTRLCDKGLVARRRRAAASSAHAPPQRGDGGVRGLDHGLLRQPGHHGTRHGAAVRGRDARSRHRRAGAYTLTDREPGSFPS